MKKINLLALAAITLVMGSCSDNGTKSEQSPYITVSTTINSMTRINTAADGSQTFSEGDKISVYAWTGSATAAPAKADRVVDNAVNTLTGQSWVAIPQMLWKNNVDKHYFIGIYPVKDVADLAADVYTLDVTNQMENDLLVAVNTTGLTSNDGGTVPLVFSHVMAKVVVNLSFKNQWGGIPDVEKVEMDNTVQQATVNYLTKTVTLSSEAKRSAIQLPVATANTKYSSVIIPQDGVQKIFVTIGGKTYTYDNGKAFDFASGKQTVVNLEVGRDQITLGDVKIIDWTDGSSFSGEALD